MKMTRFLPFILLVVLVAAGLPAVDLPVECDDCRHCGHTDHFPEYLAGLSLDQMYLEPMSLAGTTSTHCYLCRAPEQPLRREGHVSTNHIKISLSAIAEDYSSRDLILTSKYNSRFHWESADHTSLTSFYLLC
jgi:hypothetical protein